MQIEELELETLKYKKMSLNQAINFTRKEFNTFIESLLESGISKHVILQQLLENSIITEIDLRINYKIDDHTLEMVKNSARIFSTEILKRDSNLQGNSNIV